MSGISGKIHVLYDLVLLGTFVALLMFEGKKLGIGQKPVC